ncbi:MAG TPA: HD domain-containing phosphohydrolase [Desulfovibrio sp.]|uniref:HD domain-containing phosphohydrolase n=1 Tax=Desulfovibrio sp. TaxID=885 RepID=UPI002D2FF282|nr:HD domain-containing phosphohydrolase [Desulfovibrio sp.]HZF62654.1 HD domain-containing phosphohydrolase [Desulfovibrio sp.]
MESVHLYSLLSGFSRALGLVCQELTEHNLRVAYLAQVLAEHCGLDHQERKYLLIASMLHEIGTIPLKDSLTNFVFEKEDYCVAGWVFCRTAKLPEDVCNMVLLRKTPWKELTPQEDSAISANCIYFADAVDAEMHAHPDATFPKLATAMEKESGNFSYIWRNAFAHIAENRTIVAAYQSSGAMDAYLSNEFCKDILSTKNLLILCDLFSQIIDSKSPFTATHSHGVAHTAQEILKLTGLALGDDYLTIYIAGLLHDIGKLAIPMDILEKPGSLSDQERHEIKQHAEIGIQLLDSIPGFHCVCDWAGMHHERLDGKGYPYGLGAAKLTLPMRVMAVADVFTALTESRPYRGGMELASVVACMSDMAANRQLDADIVALVVKNALQINQVRSRAQRDAAAKFLAMRKLCAWTRA